MSLFLAASMGLFVALCALTQADLGRLWSVRDASSLSCLRFDIACMGREKSGVKGVVERVYGKREGVVLMCCGSCRRRKENLLV